MRATSGVKNTSTSASWSDREPGSVDVSSDGVGVTSFSASCSLTDGGSVESSAGGEAVSSVFTIPASSTCPFVWPELSPIVSIDKVSIHHLYGHMDISYKSANF